MIDGTKSGELVWTAVGIAAAFTHLDRILSTPHDDWDRRPRGILAGAPPELRYRLNSDNADVQVMYWIGEQYAHDRAAAVAHCFRFMVIEDFIGAHWELLNGLGLISDGRISDHLLAELAQAQYVDREGRASFDDAVIADALLRRRAS